MTDNKISFSQYQMWKGCQFRWKLNYIDKLSMQSPSVALIFGTAMHEVLQAFLEKLYSTTVQEANDLPVEQMLHDCMLKEYTTMREQNGGGHFSTAAELSEYYSDGVQILRWFKSHRNEFFMKKDWELVGIELPIEVFPVESRPTVRLVGYLDLVMRNTKTGKIVIYDFKTSTKGWSKWAKADKIKTAQLVLYKTFYAQQFQIPPENIDVQYLILKRKIDEDAEYLAMKKRIQRFEPSHGKISQGFILREIQDFITMNFTEEGEYRTDVFYAPTAGVDSRNCKFCEYKDRDDICPFDKRIIEE